MENVLARLTLVERDMTRMEAFLKSSVDDIKATIKGEISDLKTEQIADIRRRIESLEKRMTDAEREQAEISGGKGALAWFIRIMIALGSLSLGFYSGKHY